MVLAFPCEGRGTTFGGGWVVIKEPSLHRSEALILINHSQKFTAMAVVTDFHRISPPFERRPFGRELCFILLYIYYITMAKKSQHFLEFTEKIPKNSELQRIFLWWLQILIGESLRNSCFTRHLPLIFISSSPRGIMRLLLSSFLCICFLSNLYFYS
jgi:hypothetical protein